MAPKEPIRLALRWQFVPVRSARDGAIQWAWHAYTQTGDLAMSSKTPYETLTECVEDAKLHGFSGTGA